MNSENPDRLVAPEIQDGESQDLSLRPTCLGEYIGQSTIKENLRVFIHAARKRGQALDHVLLSGPPGLERGAWSHGPFPVSYTHLRAPET